MDYKDFVLTTDKSISDALKQLNETGRRILFMTDERGKLCGALSDGDIRRALMHNPDLEAPVSTAVNKAPKFLFDTERESAVGYMTEYRITAIPIVNENYILQDIVFLNEYADISKVQIRELLPEDEKIITDFFDQMAGDTRAMFDRGDVNRIRVGQYLRGELPNEKHFIATVKDGSGEKVVGFVFLWDIHTKVPWLGIAVHEQWKGFHLGRVLMKYIEDYALGIGAGGLILTTVPANIRAQSLYTRMGYEYMGSHTCGEYFYIKRFENKNKV